MKILLALAIGILPAVQIQSGSESKAISAFQKALRSTPKNPKTPRQRSDALEHLQGFDSKNIAKALVKAYVQAGSEVFALDRLRMQNIDEFEALKKAMDPKTRKFKTKEELARYKELHRIRPKLRRKVDDLRELEFAIRERITKLQKVESLSYLLKNVVGSKKYNILLKLAVARTAGGLGEPMLSGLHRSLAKAKRYEELVALLDGLGLIGKPAKQAAPTILELLGHKHGAVRERAALALSRIAVPEAIEPMIQLLGREEGQAKKRIGSALEVLTSQQFADNVSTWKAWFAKEGQEYVSGGMPLGGGTPSIRARTNAKNYYFGIPQDGKAILYIIDSSGSMKKPVELKPVERKSGKTAVKGGNDGNDRKMTRLEACKKELIRALGRLEPKTRFAVIWYSTLPHIWRKTMSLASKDSVRQAQDWVRVLNPKASTNIHDSLQMGFGMVGRGKHDKAYGTELDTIFLLTDGSPTTPDGKLDSTEKIIKAVRTWNPLKRVTIHCIGIGRGLNVSFLRQLASENGGEFKQY